MMKLCFLVVVAFAAAQPPLSRNYLPPGQQDGNGYSRGGQQPSSQYGAPSADGSRFGGQSSSGGRPSSQYGAPSAGGSRFGGQSSSGGRPSSQFGAPSAGGNRFGGQSSSGGRPSNQYGAPSAFGDRASAPSSQYGAPSAGGSRFGGQSSSGGRPSSEYGVPSRQGDGGYAGLGGSNGQDDSLSEPANYEFSYEVLDDASGNNFGHQESRQGDEARGSYHVLLPDGRTQIVDYVANDEGYTPTIRYEEAQGGQGGYSGGRASGQGGYRY